VSEELLIDVSTFESRVALVQDGAVVEVHLARAAGYSVTGNIYLGKVVRVVPGMQAAFVEIGLERPGFLHLSDIENPLVMTPNQADNQKLGIRDVLHDGQELLVIVERDPLGSKGARLSTRLSLASKYLVLMPTNTQVRISQKITDEAERSRLFKVLRPLSEQSTMGVIARTQSEGVPANLLAEDLLHLGELWRHLQQQLQSAKAPAEVFQELPIQTRLVRDLAGPNTVTIYVNDTDIFQRLQSYLSLNAAHLEQRLRLYEERKPLFARHNIEREIADALLPRVPLKSGGTLVIEQTEALISIDVNTAGYLGSNSLEQTIYVTNMEAAAAIPRQLRLRNLGGIVVIDFIDMTQASHRDAVMAKLSEELSKDPAKTQVDGFSFLGLVQLSRKRTRESLVHVMCARCEYCAGQGLMKTAETVCMEILRMLAAECDSVEHPQGFRDGYYTMSGNAAVIERLLEEEAVLYKAMTARLPNEVRLQVDSAYRLDQFDLIFVPQSLH
jgi:ribonuclease G